MKVGLFGINVAGLADPELMVAVAEAADKTAIESVWTGEHVVLVDPQEAPSPIPANVPLVHPSTALSYLAARTTTLRLGTGVTLLPQHNPVVVAKEFASLDHLSGGRLMLGVGVGYVDQEYRALGVPYQERGARADEYIDVLRDLWISESPSHHGKFVDVRGVNAYPRPVQQPPPILIGGSSAPAYRRVVQRGNGWYGFGDVAGVREVLRGISEAEGAYGRPAALGPIEISVTPTGVPDAEALDRFQELGVDRLVMGFQAYGLPRTTDGYLNWVENVAKLAEEVGS